MLDRFVDLTAEELAAEELVRAYLLHDVGAADWEAWLAAHPEVAVRVLAARKFVVRPPAGGKPAALGEPAALLVGSAGENRPVGRLGGTDASAHASVHAEQRAGIAGWAARGEWGKLFWAAVGAVALLLAVWWWLRPGKVEAVIGGLG